MTARLSAQDASFFFLERSTPMHGGSVAIFRCPRGGFTYEALLNVVESRLPAVPRYRQKVREVTLGLSLPVWVDDPDFDIEYHVRRSALPSPGSEARLWDLVARLMSRPLDPARPLWEMYLVEGLGKGDGNGSGRFAIVTKSHSSLVDGVEALDIGQVIVDETRTPEPPAEDLWMPAPEPSDATLAAAALGELVMRPAEGVSAVRHALADFATSAGRALGALEKAARLVHTATNSAPDNPLNAPISRSRRYATARTPLADYRALRERYDCEIHDVVLTVVTGALRGWLQSRGELVGESTIVRAMVPISVYDTEDADGAPGAEGDDEPAGRARVSSCLVDLPVGEPSPAVRLSHIAHATASSAGHGRRVTARTMARLPGFAPATLHAVGARVATSFSQRMFNLVVTNAPGPQRARYVGGAQLTQMYPVAPLLPNQTLSIALTSYDGDVYYGLNADRDAMSDVDVVASLLTESLEELSEYGR
ncbi:wax ester/triacylglycerol synthase family O-acyltransferase [Rhodococcus rhodnii]|uniref:Diacylglycerol O-acyltransferase n=2 Tax=Rhodococcus rhodnii TaxID=38312 RepID=R7WJB4_9NOCA|nr:wax ester/triacylglycerol synthase family O-acyltransferase [Rhodococcus rhodnii]EOM75363.1 hypothetical protein Rrhod_3161 [Rhodococcus rhodnii LMG 5362]TXG90589.1 wax ester/triacylglycerol synthase family O-acyltransferase [Rhodococcus rhodnii]